jgi:redox-sensitive bicupin YhaK (pirin superfamily)
MIIKPLQIPWQTPDPFLFCMYHNDAYPPGNDRLGPAASLAGHHMGQDFEGKDGWRMYHGQIVPGFPQHPHRGFETVTIMRKGYIDHSDSLGATARFGPGDVQWLTAGRGIVHCEMFPLLNPSGPNPLELFQIWLNLPSNDKMVDAHFSMLWDEQIPKHTADGTEILAVAGSMEGIPAPPSPPKSWARHSDTDVKIWTIKMAPGAQWTLPGTRPGTNRTLYFFRGRSIQIDNRTADRGVAMFFDDPNAVRIQNGSEESEFLLLQGRPIAEPIAQYGPFVMNTRNEIQQAFQDYQRTGFGGWPWPSDEPVFARTEGRFARHADGRVERPLQQAR